MKTRRNFLTFGALAGAAAVTPNALLTQSFATTSASKGTSVHQASLKILMKHMRAMSRNHSHNPFATSELATMARFHFGSMEDSGHNARITTAVRSSGAVPITASNIDPILNGMRAYGIDFGSDAESFVKYILPSASAAICPALTASLNNGHNVIKVQRSVHAELVKLSEGGHSQMASKATYAAMPHLSRAGYVSPKLLRVLEEIDPNDCLCDEGSGAWYDSGWSGSQYNSGDYWDPTYTSYLGSGWSSYLPTTYTTPSGAVINLCTVFWAIMSMSAASWSALIASQQAGAAFGIGFVAANPELAVAMLAIAAAIAAYLAIVC